MPPLPAIRILATSLGNDVMLEVTHMLSEGLAAQGMPCEVAIDALPLAATPAMQLMVAPHEYVPLFLEARVSASQVRHAVARTFVLNVEQPGSHWFELAYRHARLAKGVFDISLDGVAEFRRRGIPATHLRLGYLPTLEALVSPDSAHRPIDILFMGHLSPRREAFFARHAALFSTCNCHLVLADLAGIRRLDTPGYIAGADRRALLASSKILLNVHTGERRYFETHRALLALANRCLLISESSRHTAPLVNGQHFVMAPLEEIPNLCRQYLADLPALSAIALRGHAFVKEHVHMRSTCVTLVEAAAATETPNGQGGNLAADVRHEDAKRRAASERLEASQRQRARGDRVWDAVPNAAHERSAPPAVSVVIALCNYARYIDECLASVIASESPDGGFEVVVVDDGSSDDSAERVLQRMSRTDIPILLVRKHANTGVSDTRNTGLECARARYVFMLDADNWIFPACLHVLHAEIAESGAAGVYGIIGKFEDDSGESAGLVSAYAWDVAALVRQPYIDAMAMFDRDRVLDVGGYSIEPGWFGWEDYDLWLKLAQSGQACQRIPRIVGAYRVHANSMLLRTSRRPEDIKRYFHRKFDALMRRYPDGDRYFGFSRAGAGVAPRLGEGDFGALQQHCEEVEQRIADVYASASWRVTGPLRWAYRWLTGRP